MYRLETRFNGCATLDECSKMIDAGIPVSFEQRKHYDEFYVSAPEKLVELPSLEKLIE